MTVHSVEQDSQHSGEESSTVDALQETEGDVDVIGEDEDEHDIPVMPTVTSSGEVLDESQVTPTKQASSSQPREEIIHGKGESVYSSFPCQVIPETLSRMTRTPPDGEHLEVYRMSNGRLRIYVVDHFKKFSPYSNLTHKPCTVCNRVMKSGEMHLNFPADLDRRRIWANLLGFKYKDILRSKMGPVSFSIAAGPICTEHFAEECFRNHNFNKSAIEAFGVPVAISPDVKTTPSKKSSRVPWVCTVCEFHSCSVVELQTHLLNHTEEMLKKKDNVLDVPEAGFMCPFCRKCTYGYKTISGYRRHLNAGPIHHCHLRRIYEFAKMNCRATELDPAESWDNWTRRNVYVAYHGCEPPANEIVLTPSPTKKAYVQNPEERTKMVHDEEKRKKAVRTLSFVGKEGGTSVNDLNVMQRQVFLQLRREAEINTKAEESAQGTKEQESSQKKHAEEESDDVSELTSHQSPQAPMGSGERRKATRLATSATNSPIKKVAKHEVPATAPSTPAKKRKISHEEEHDPTPESVEREPTVSPNDPRERLRLKERDEQFAKMVQKRSQQVKRLINAKQFKKQEAATKKPRKALAYNLAKGIAATSSTEPEDKVTSSEQTPEPTTSQKFIARNTRSKTKESAVQKVEKPATPVAKPAPVEKEPEERPLKSMLARSFVAGVRPSMAKYQIPLESFTATASLGGGRSLSSGVISRPPTSSSPGGIFSQRVMGAVAQEKGPAKRPSVLSRRPLILSPRKKTSTPRPTLSHHESSPNFSASSPVVVSDEYLIPATDMEVEMVEEVIDSMGNSSSEDVATSSTSSERQPMLTLAEALEMDGSSGTVKDQDMEEISKEMMKDAHYYRAMEDAIKCRTVTKMRADMRLSRHCIRQIEAARARARLFGERTEDYQIFYSNDGAQVLTKKDPKWRELQQQQQQQQQQQEQFPGQGSSDSQQ